MPTAVNYDQRMSSLRGIAFSIAKQIAKLHSMNGGKAPATSISYQFNLICRGANPKGGPLTTAEMALLASQLVPEATALLNNERLAA